MNCLIDTWVFAGLNMAVYSVQHGFICNNVILEIEESGVNTTTAILLLDTVSLLKFQTHFFPLCSQIKL